LLFQRLGALMAQRFDADRLRVIGEPARIATDVAFNRVSGRAAFAAAGDVLAYRTSGPGQSSRIGWFDRSGKPLGQVGQEGIFGPASQIVLSPDETKVAVTRLDQQAAAYDVWVLELSSGVFTRLTLDPANDNDPAWSPDSRAVAFNSNRKGSNDFYQRMLGGSDDSVIFESADPSKFVGDWSGDGQYLLYHSDSSQTIFALPMSGERKPIPLNQTPYAKNAPHFSPDGRWIAYQTDESGAPEVFVASFPDFADKRQVSLGGGGAPRWRADGQELFYLSPDGKLMAVAISWAPTPAFAAPTVLFQTPIQTPNLNLDQYAVSRDGQRFLVLSTEDTAPVPITVVLNWRAGLN
jgi:Tol biopolymer transport system component